MSEPWSATEVEGALNEFFAPWVQALGLSVEDAAKPGRPVSYRSTASPRNTQYCRPRETLGYVSGSPLC